jgi:hypothetical protein
MERLIRIYDDDCGDFVQISPDADSLDLVEFRQYSSKEEILARITMPLEAAKLFSLALIEYVQIMDKEPK